jgi:hypothetical protein
MNQFFIKRAEYVEVLVPNGNQKQQIYFPDLPNLRTSKIFGIEVFCVETQSISKTGNNVQEYQQIANANIVLYFEGGEFIEVPASSLLRIRSRFDGDGGSIGYFQQIPMLAGQQIVWAKSYIYLTDVNNIGSYENQSYVFSVYYSKNNI